MTRTEHYLAVMLCFSRNRLHMQRILYINIISRMHIDLYSRTPCDVLGNVRNHHVCCSISKATPLLDGDGGRGGGSVDKKEWTIIQKRLVF